MRRHLLAAGAALILATGLSAAQAQPAAAAAPAVKSMDAAERRDVIEKLAKTLDANWGWEGQGVTPDVAVHIDQALDEALKLAKAKGARP